MAGTLTLSTISDGSVSTSSTNCIQGSAKAWVSFNGTAATVTASYNVSSVTRSGTGSYVVNFTNAFANANYTGLAMSGSFTADGIGAVLKSTTQCSINNVDSRTYGFQDTTRMNCAFFN